jgi:hypothetical protein
MPDQPEGKFRDRVEDSEGGLTREDGRRRPSTGGIEFTPLEDMADAVAGFMPIADRLAPEGDFGGESDAESMDDFGVGLLVAQQKSDKCRMLLERAQKLIASGDWRGALATADEAVAADSTSGEAWALKGRCLAEMGHHEAPRARPGGRRRSAGDGAAAGVGVHPGDHARPGREAGQAGGGARAGTGARGGG